MTDLKLPTWRECLNSIQDVQTVSSTWVSVHVREIADKTKEIVKAKIGGNQPAEVQKQQSASVLGGWEYDFSALTVFKSTSRAAITYLALNALSKFSLYVNGFVGAGKVALAIVTGVVTKAGTEKYLDAQNLLEQGVFHIASAVADFAIGYFSWIAAGIALANGLAPRQTQQVMDQAFLWKGAIVRRDNEGQAAIEKDRAAYSWLQILADKVQRFVLPDEGADRLQALFQPSKAQQA